MKHLIISNNPKVIEEYQKKTKVVEIEGELLDVLMAVRDEVHSGRQLLTHPLTGSVKPNETMFKSVIVSEEKTQLDMQSLEIIENSIKTAEKLLNDQKPKMWTDQILEDFMLIDFNLVTSGYQSMMQFY